MAITRVSFVNRVEADPLGGVGVQIVLALVEGDRVVSQRYHRTYVAYEASVPAQMEEVNRHLLEMGEEPVSQEDIDRVGRIAEQAVPVHNFVVE